jgi:E3 ubiquitin-protein ligase UBR4
MLEEMTSGTEEETLAFMAVLIDTIKKTPMKDIKTPIFIFERLCSVLQGRVLSNPYPSTEAGLGPLMRDGKK